MEERMKFGTGLFHFVFNLNQSVYSSFVITGFRLVGALVFLVCFFFPPSKKTENLQEKGESKTSV